MSVHDDRSTPEATTTSVPSPAAPESTPDEAPTPVEITRADLRAIDLSLASATARTLLGTFAPEERYDVRQDVWQELALRLADGRLMVYGLATAAANLLRTAVRNDANRRKLESDYATGGGRRYRVGSLWEPRWYPPIDGATEHAPFACAGARVMRVRGGAPPEDGETSDPGAPAGAIDLVQSTMAEVIDERRGSK